MPDTYMTSSAAARAIGVSVTSSFNYEDKGLLRATRTTGGMRLFSGREVEEFARQRRARQQPNAAAVGTAR